MSYLAMPFYNVMIFIVPYFLMFFCINIRNFRIFSLLYVLFYLFAILVFLFNKPITGGDILEYFNRYLSQVDYYRLEPLFGLYTEFIKFLGFSPSAYVSILSFSCFILQLLTFSYVCKENRLLAFMLLLFNSFALLTWSGIYKNGISIPFLILAFYALSNRNVLLSFTSVTIACLFHTSAIIYYPVLIYLSIFKKEVKLEKVLILICAVSILISFVFDFHLFKSIIRVLVVDYLKPFIPEAMARPLRYFTADVTEFNNSDSVYLLQTSRVSLEIFIQFFVFFFLSKLHLNKHNVVSFWRRAYILSVFIYSLTIGVAFSYRFYLATSFIFTVYLYFVMIYSSKKQYFMLSLYLVISYLIFCFYSLPPEKIGLMYLNPLNIGY